MGDESGTLTININEGENKAVIIEKIKEIGDNFVVEKSVDVKFYENEYIGDTFGTEERPDDWPRYQTPVSHVIDSTMSSYMQGMSTKQKRKAIINQIETNKPSCETQNRCNIIPKGWQTYKYEVVSEEKQLMQEETVGNLYFMLPSMTFRRTLKGRDALNAYFRCFFEDMKDTFEISVPDDASAKNFVSAMKDQCYYYYDEVNQKEGSPNYIFQMNRAKLYKSKGGSSPSIARWMGAIAGTFVVVASAFVPRLG